MSDGASKYPVSLLLARLIADCGDSPTDFIKRLGYRNIERGLRRLDPWLNNGEGFHRIIRQIIATFPRIEIELRLSIEATKVMKKAESQVAWVEQCEAERDTFAPYIHVDGERTVPSGIVLFAISGGKWNRIEIPKADLDLPLDEQLATLPTLMRSYLALYQGQCPFFGKVKNFRFVRLLDYFLYDRSGVLIGQVPEPFRRSPCYVGLR